MKTIITLTCALLSLSSWALSPYEVCDAITSNSETVRCLEVVQGARYFDPGILNICSHITSNSETTNCMRAAADHHFQYQAAQVCNNITSNSETVRCVDVIADSYYDPAALNVCNRISSNSETVSCLQRLRGRDLGGSGIGG